MTILSIRTDKQGVKVYTVTSNMSKDEADKLNGTYVQPKHIKTIINHDADVYTHEGDLLLRFRKNVLPRKRVEDAYNAMISFAKNTTLARGAASGTRVKHVTTNKKIASNIMGFFDQWTLLHRHMFKVLGVKSPPFPVRATRFTADNPNEWRQIIPLIKDIDALYKKLVPKHYAMQRSMADETAYKIQGTAFSTITTNLNLVTAIHKDKGNVKQSFGNLVVIEKGQYQGGYTCYPEFGIGVDVRLGDFLAMDVHRFHGNLPIVAKSEECERLSIVCYLRHYIWERTRGSSVRDVEDTMKATKDMIAKYYAIRKK